MKRLYPTYCLHCFPSAQPLQMVLAIKEATDYLNVQLCAKILFNIDPLNEEALRYMIKTQSIGEAKSRYQEYITRYKKEYGESYTQSFEELCQ